MYGDTFEESFFSSSLAFSSSLRFNFHVVIDWPRFHVENRTYILLIFLNQGQTTASEEQKEECVWKKRAEKILKVNKIMLNTKAGGKNDTIDAKLSSPTFPSEQHPQTTRYRIIIINHTRTTNTRAHNPSIRCGVSILNVTNFCFLLLNEHLPPSVYDVDHLFTIRRLRWPFERHSRDR